MKEPPRPRCARRLIDVRASTPPFGRAKLSHSHTLDEVYVTPCVYDTRRFRFRTMTSAVGRRCVASLLSLAVIAAGGAVAHVVAYSLVSPDAGTHDDRVMHSGHGGANLHWHLCLAVCGSVALVGLASSLVDRL